MLFQRAEVHSLPLGSFIQKGHHLKKKKKTSEGDPAKVAAFNNICEFLHSEILEM